MAKWPSNKKQLPFGPRINSLSASLCSSIISLFNSYLFFNKHAVLESQHNNCWSPVLYFAAITGNLKNIFLSLFQWQVSKLVNCCNFSDPAGPQALLSVCHELLISCVTFPSAHIFLFSLPVVWHIARWLIPQRCVFFPPQKAIILRDNPGKLRKSHEEGHQERLWSCVLGLDGMLLIPWLHSWDLSLFGTWTPTTQSL